MPVFEYEVADPTGAISRGRAEAENAGALVLRFREQDRWVLNVRPAGRSAFAEDAGLQAIVTGFQRVLLRLFRGVQLGTLLLFTGQLSAMLAGGLHLARILSSLAAESSNKRFQAILSQVREAISAGSTFANALSQHPHVF